MVGEKFLPMEIGRDFLCDGRWVNGGGENPKREKLRKRGLVWFGLVSIKKGGTVKLKSVRLKLKRLCCVLERERECASGRIYLGSTRGGRGKF